VSNVAPFLFISAIIGMSAAILHPGIVPAEALPKVVLGLSPWAAGVILAGLWAADVSTASALLMGSATLVSSDIVKRFFAPNLSPAKDQALCRVAVTVLSVVTFLLALTVQGILKVLLIGLTLSTAYTLIVIMTMYCPKLCRRSSATWTLATTMLCLAAWLIVTRFTDIKLPHAIYFTWATSIVTFLVVPIFDRRRIATVKS
jgi:SSS family solute:Na+ symporter